MPLRRQFKIRLVQKPSSPTNVQVKKPTTIATATKTTTAKMSISTAKWLTDQPNPIPFTIYESPSTALQKLTNVKAQEIPQTQSWEKKATLVNAVNKYPPLQMPVTPTP